MQDSIIDFSAYTIHDGVKKRKIPDLEMLVENAIPSFGYNMVAPAVKQTTQALVPEISQPYADDIFKFLGQSGLIWGYRYLQGKDRKLAPIMLKQLLSQGGAMIYKTF